MSSYGFINISACKKHENIEMAAWTAKHIHKSNSNDSAVYIVMSNIHAASGQFEDAIKQRILMKENQVSKERGGSSIEINDQAQEFVSAGKLHPQMRELLLNLHFHCEDDDLSLIHI